VRELLNALLDVGTPKGAAASPGGTSKRCGLGGPRFIILRDTPLSLVLLGHLSVMRTPFYEAYSIPVPFYPHSHKNHEHPPLPKKNPCLFSSIVSFTADHLMLRLATHINEKGITAIKHCLLQYVENYPLPPILRSSSLILCHDLRGHEHLGKPLVSSRPHARWGAINTTEASLLMHRSCHLCTSRTCVVG